ncbi:SpoIID/LytB domain-containing protein [Candidatus Caldatribacterium sp.]|uniref:SpoIID/LytB domain-containing protein n=1 Tax=Candidatus Caldatribacterium sp. TaxID=2282143 RepID=UPI0029981F4D|nr:SpoIID/LytB domain-containing protein [Candidatus Caldatribacterium sp.]MDW8081549.1 SpoIID/LytB domain-containing protein [Candidatus Calescibacterium sp.]
MRTLGIFLAVTLVLGAFAWSEGKTKDVMVRVLLLRTPEGVTCSSPERLRVQMEKKVFAVPARCPLSLLPDVSGVLWKEKGIVAASLVLTPEDGVVYLGKRPYRGRLEIRKRGNDLEVINILPLDEYLKGTMKLEVSPSWPEEALKAHIVVARTYALKNLGRHREEGFDFCATVHCQRYGGVFAEDARTNALIEETRGVVLTYRGELAGVVFHSESGGYTDSSEHVWGKKVPYLVEVPSPWEDGAPRAFWRVTLTSEEIAEALRRWGYVGSVVLGLRCQKSTRSGRVTKVFVDTDCGTVELTGNQFREIIGFDRLPSTMFDVECTPQGQEERSVQDGEVDAAGVNFREWLERDWNLDDIITFLKLREAERKARKRGQRVVGLNHQRPTRQNSGPSFTFVGRGWGHGVGLSQWGAVGMARNGAGFSEILHHYFPGCELGRVVIR